jgi:hypothetical protein
MMSGPVRLACRLQLRNCGPETAPRKRTRTGTKYHFGEMDSAGPRTKFDSENVREHGSESGKVSEVGEIPSDFQNFPKGFG